MTFAFTLKVKDKRNNSIDFFKTLIYVSQRNILIATGAYSSSTVCFPLCLLVSVNSSAGSITKNTLQGSQKITLHHLNKYKAICHCHVRVDFLCLPSPTLSSYFPLQRRRPSTPGFLWPAQRQEALLVIVLTPAEAR